MTLAIYQIVWRHGNALEYVDAGGETGKTSTADAIRFARLQQYGSPPSKPKPGGVAPTRKCDTSYPTVGIPPPPPDLDCADIRYRNFKVSYPIRIASTANKDRIEDDFGVSELETSLWPDDPIGS